MEGKQGEMGLLEYLAESMQCTYMSDLVTKWAGSDKDLVLVIHQIPLEAYSLEEWADASLYFTRKKQIFQSREEAKKALIKAVE